MARREFTEAEIYDALEGDDVHEIDGGHWRHGRNVTYVFAHEGKHWQFTANVHHDEGIQLYGPVTATQVHQVEKTVKVWEPVP